MTTLPLKKRLRKGLCAQGIIQSIQIFIRFAEVPLFLAFWGTQLYGEWLIISSIPIYLSIVEGGFTAVARREMAMKNGEIDRKEIKIIFQTTLLLIYIYFVFILLLSFLILNCIDLGALFGINIIQDFDFHLIIFIYVFYVFFGSQINLIIGGFWIDGRYSIGMYMLAFIQLFEFLSLTFSILIGGGPIHAAFSYLVARVIGTLILSLLHRRMTPWLKYSFSSISYKTLRRLVPPAFSTIAFPFGSALNIQGIRILVGLILGPSFLAIFVPMRTLSRTVLQPVAIINRLIEPELSFLYGNDDYDTFRQVFSRSNQFSLWTCLMICILFLPFTSFIYSTWTNNQLTVLWPVYLSLILSAFLNSIWNTSLVALYATNRHISTSFHYVFIYGIVTILIAFIATIKFELIGTSMSLLFVEILMIIVIIPESLKITNLSLSSWIKKVIYPPLDYFKFI